MYKPRISIAWLLTVIIIALAYIGGDMVWHYQTKQGLKPIKDAIKLQIDITNAAVNRQERLRLEIIEQMGGKIANQPLPEGD
jgi:hypothetical protein